MAEGRAHYDQALALYDPAAHRPLAARFGADIRVAILSYRSLALWTLGYPESALADAEHALGDAREMGQAANFLFALGAGAWILILCGNYAAASAQADELVALAVEKGAVQRKALGILNQGRLLVLTGKASDAVQMMNSGLAAFRSTGATTWMPWHLSFLASAHAQLGQFDDAWRCIGEAMTAVETQRKDGAKLRSIATRGNRAQVARIGCRESASVFRACARGLAYAAGKVLGIARRDEHGAALARSGQAAASSRAARSDLRLVYRRVRHP
jgi:tetratricopeptide (TPR) repeat protein